MKISKIAKILSSAFLVSSIFGPGTILYADEKDSSVLPKKRVSILVPAKHKALDEIVDGFQSELKSLYKGEIEFKITNALGDGNTINATVKQAKTTRPDIFVSIGTKTTETAAHDLLPKTAVLGLASLPLLTKKTGLAIVADELPMEKFVAFFKGIFPNAKKLLVVHSSDEKIAIQIKEMGEVCAKHDLDLKTMMIHEQSDLFNNVAMLPKDRDAIFILKDHKVVGGISILIKEAKARRIPLVTSDEGSIYEGADIALGFRERDIGKKGARIGGRILNGENVTTVETFKDEELSIFLNERSLSLLGLTENSKAPVKVKGYNLVILKK